MNQPNKLKQFFTKVKHSLFYGKDPNTGELKISDTKIINFLLVAAFLIIIFSFFGNAVAQKRERKTQLQYALNLYNNERYLEAKAEFEKVLPYSIDGIDALHMYLACGSKIQELTEYEYCPTCGNVINSTYTGK